MEWLFLVLGLLLVTYLSFGVRKFDEYQRGVVYTLGRQTRTAGPGLSVIMPGLETLKYVNVKQKTLDLEEMHLTVIGGKVNVKAAVFTKITDPMKSLQVEDLDTTIKQSARSNIKVVFGEKDLEYIVKHGSKVLESVKDSLAEEAKSWGVQILSVKVYDFNVKGNIKPSLTKVKKKPEPVREVSTEVEVDNEFLLD